MDDVRNSTWIRNSLKDLLSQLRGKRLLVQKDIIHIEEEVKDITETIARLHSFEDEIV